MLEQRILSKDFFDVIVSPPRCFIISHHLLQHNLILDKGIPYRIKINTYCSDKKQAFLNFMKE